MKPSPRFDRFFLAFVVCLGAFAAMRGIWWTTVGMVFTGTAVVIRMISRRRADSN